MGNLLLVFHFSTAPAFPQITLAWLCRAAVLGGSRMEPLWRLPVCSLNNRCGDRCGVRSGNPLRTLQAPSTNYRATAVRHALTRRCKVRNCPGANDIEVSSCNRKNRPFAVMSGCSLSHPCTSGQTSWKGSIRVRHGRGPVNGLRCVGRTSPSRQAVDRPATNFVRSSFWLAVPPTPALTSCPLRVCCASRIRLNKWTGSKLWNTRLSSSLQASATPSLARSRS